MFLWSDLINSTLSAVNAPNKIYVHLHAFSWTIFSPTQKDIGEHEDENSQGKYEFSFVHKNMKQFVFPGP